MASEKKLARHSERRKCPPELTFSSLRPALPANSAIVLIVDLFL